MTRPADLLRAVRPEAAADADLLARFAADREPTAFAELVRRHGALVLGVCRRVTGHAADAEDAFQAAFLVLARKAGAVRQPDRLGGYLYGVAYRVARKARRRAARRRLREVQVAVMPDPTIADAEPTFDLRPVLDEELAALPEWCRLPLVLCELQGLSRADAARRLGVPEGTLSSRLAAARRKLGERLARRGLTLAIPAAVPESLLAKAVDVACGGAAGGAVPAAVAELAGGGVTMRAVILSVGLAAMVGGAGLAAAWPADDPPKSPAPAKAEPVRLGKPRMTHFADLPMRPSAVFWDVERGGPNSPAKDRLYVFGRPSNGPLGVTRMEFIGRSQPERPNSVQIPERSELVGTHHGKALVVRRESAGINTIHQLTLLSVVPSRPYVDKADKPVPDPDNQPVTVQLTADTGFNYLVSHGRDQDTGNLRTFITSDFQERDGQKVVRWGVRRIDAATGDPVHTLLTVEGSVRQVELSPNERFVVGTGDAARTVRCWDLADEPARQLWSMPVPEGMEVIPMRFTPNSERVVVGVSPLMWADYAYAVEMARGITPTTPAKQVEHARNVMASAEKRVTRASAVSVIDAETGRVVREFPFPKEERPSWSSRLVCSHDGRLIFVSGEQAGVPRFEPGASGGIQHMAVVLDADTGARLQKWDGFGLAAFAPDRHTLAIAEPIGDGAGRLGFWDFTPPPAGAK